MMKSVLLVASLGLLRGRFSPSANAEETDECDISQTKFFLGYQCDGGNVAAPR